MGKPTSVRHRAFISPTFRSFDPQRTQVFYSACCSLFLAAFTWTVPHSHRAWLVEGIRHRDDKLQETPGTVAQQPAFRRAGKTVAEEFVEGEKIDNDVNWKRAEEYDALAQEMIELYIERQEASDTKQDTDCVKHLGHGVYVQRNKHGIDTDATVNNPVTITREESRSVVYHALDALEEHSNVCVTGQPGIGKTRGCMMYAMQALLYQGAALLYVGYKSKRMLLFLPGEDGSYRVWTTTTRNFDYSFLALDERVVAVIDPPEEGTYSSMAECRVLKFVSNNAMLHFRNWEKDGILLVTSMPTKKEVIAMTPVLWSERVTPHAWQVGEVNTAEEKVAEIEKRIELIGPIPRLVFNSTLLRKSISDCRGSAREAAERISDLELYEAMLGKYTPFVEKHPMSVTGKLFHLLPDPVHCETWEERIEIGIEPVLQLTAVSKYELRDRLERSIEALRKKDFEDFAFDWVCATEGRLPEIQYDDEDQITESAYQRIASLRDCEQRIYRPASEIFPMVDFATSCITWINAKSTKNDKAIEVGIDGARKFLRELQECIDKTGSSAYFKEFVKREAPTLIVLKNRNVEVKLNTEEDLKIFDENVQIKDIDLSDTGKSTSDCFKELSAYNRTVELLRELEREQGKLSFRRARL